MSLEQIKFICDLAQTKGICSLEHLQDVIGVSGTFEQDIERLQALPDRKRKKRING